MILLALLDFESIDDCTCLTMDRIIYPCEVISAIRHIVLETLSR